MRRSTEGWLPVGALGASLGLAVVTTMAVPIVAAEPAVKSQSAQGTRNATAKTAPSANIDSEITVFGTLDEARANARRSDETVAALTAALGSQDDRVRRHAAMALGGKGPDAKAATAALEKMLRRADAADRLEAAIALGRIGPDAKVAAPSLEALPKDENVAVRAAAAQALASVRWTIGAPCGPTDVPPSAIHDGRAICLNIAPRDDAPAHPSEGWCAEVAIQEALLSFGAYFPQKAINAAGHPEHPDLYADEIPTALKNLHVRFVAWPWDGPPQELPRFLRWTRRWIAARHPVLVGVKIYPTEHADWSLDHFSLAVGTAEKAILFNTSWGYRATCTEQQLTSVREGFSFANDQHRYYGICIQGMERHPAPPKVSLHVLCEAKGYMNVAVNCEGLERGRQYRLVKSSDDADSAGAPKATLRAQSTTTAIYDRIAKGRPCIYWCKRIP
jgi:hypothetical protein